MTQLNVSEIAYLLGLDFIHYKVNLESSSPFCKFVETLRRVGDEMDQKYDHKLIWMVNQLSVESSLKAKETVYTIFDAMFEDGVCSWGRIVTMYVFTARLAKYCKNEKNSNTSVEDLSTYVSDYIVRHLARWIEDQGRWANFYDHFKSSDAEKKSPFMTCLMGIFLSGLFFFSYMEDIELMTSHTHIKSIHDGKEHRT
ncbi:Induced myeloid leukemia cell differentiation protein Mcl-1-like [Holothuria leucospilota]|uniref:Induced myeloid leukemia cell differentiation protein Mcl-1-like n=1 Tax=Holothuria leucospilota TaxID=206669 RepID=A0A9Q1HL93_HOLLE|nr:Induced myeloid leukemia cell differentiation protein Mcl-1-like [Holothuria leucospilota]